VGRSDTTGAGLGAGADGGCVRERITIAAIAPRTITSASARAATMNHLFRDTKHSSPAVTGKSQSPGFSEKPGDSPSQSVILSDRRGLS